MSATGPGASAGSVVVLVVGTMVIGTSAVLVELAATDPLTVSAYRLGYAMVVLWALVLGELRLRGLRCTPRALVPTCRETAAGVLFAASVILQNVSIDLLGAGLATVLDNTHVVLLALAAWLVTGRRPARAVRVAVVMVTGGVALVAWPSEGGVAVDGWGVVAALLTACAYSAYISLLSPHDTTRPLAGLVVLPVCRIVSTAFPVTLLGAVASGADLAPPASAHGWMLCLAIGPQVLGWTLLTVGARGVPAVTTGLVLTLQPVFTVLLAAPVLGEWPDTRHLLGSVLVVLGIVACTGSRTPDPQQMPRRVARQEHEVTPASRATTHSRPVAAGRSETRQLD